VIVDAILYVVDNGIKWRALPADFPPWPTVYKRFAAWEKTGTTQRLLDGLRDQARLSAGRVAAPSAAVMDSQSVRAAETVSRATRGYDAGKKVQGRKRHIVVDTVGFLLAVLVTPASTPDRVAARHLLPRAATTAGDRLRLVWADGGYTGTLLDWARTTLDLIVQIVRRPDLPRFTVLPRRWVVERTLAWITRHRRCVRDYERHPHHHEAMVRWAMIRITTRRLTQ
jgi:transposase